MTLWMLFAAMLVMALLFVLPPLLRQARTRGPNQDEINVVVHRKRLTELEADLASGSLNEAQFAQAREDLERELLHELADAADTATTHAAPSTGRVSAVIVAIAIPLLALGLYYKLGSWRALEVGTAGSSVPVQEIADSGMSNATPDAAMSNNNMPPVDEMVKRLEQKLQKEPNDATGWLMLGRSYVYLNRYTDAVRAYAQAETLTQPPDAQLYAEYAEAMALANGDSLAGAPERLLENALALQPDNPNALWLAGMSAFQKADYPTAISSWEILQKSAPPDSEQGRMLANYLAQARAGQPLEEIVPPR
ncbi:MAG: c-type cytochrome biogenesis protein CcmI, partial [Armatimonadetes bacterium]|nr:c-type cytochrome biogenesis protein CcmI [Armatimonadota bacterium]